MSVCKDGAQPADSGLVFDVSCDMDVSAKDIYEAYMPSLDRCINICSIHKGALCHGATYRPASGRCALTGAGARSNRTTSRPGVILAVAREDQFEPLPTACPFEDLTERVTANGMKFQIQCRADFFGDDTAMQGGALTRIFTRTMDECLEHCSSGHQLCLGVAWNPDLANGYLNCDPKFSNDRNKLASRSYAVHSALAVKATVDGTCTEGGEYTASGRTFAAKCRTAPSGRVGIKNEIAVIHAASLSGCVDECASHGAGNASAPACNAVLFTGNATYGYGNCRLRRSVGDTEPAADFSLAVVTNNGTESDVKDLGGQEGDHVVDGGGRPAYKRPVVWASASGGLVALLLLLGLAWWLRRRRKDKKGLSCQSDSGGRPADWRASEVTVRVYTEICKY